EARNIQESKSVRHKFQKHRERLETRSHKLQKHPNRKEMVTVGNDHTICKHNGIECHCSLPKLPRSQEIKMLVAKSSQHETRHLIDQLRAVGLDKYIELPQIAVMGDTSSGKSSVLSALSGITFPSSGNLTTRCPTQLILTQSKKFSGTVRLLRFDPAVESLPPTPIHSIDEVTTYIESITQQLVDEGQSISDDAIEIKLHGPDFPDLTLTDLPGLVRSVGDHEDKAMISRVDKLVHRYLVQDRTVILAVVPANVDMHNTAIIQAAEEADPDGVRTISIITKPDLIDQGAEDAVVDLLLNRTKYRRLGYHVVKCRGQKALNNNESIQQGRDNESLFFDSHAVWSTVDKSLCGTGRLAEKLTRLLMDTVCKALPKVVAEIDVQLAACKDKLVILGEPMSTPAVRRATFMKNVRLVLDRLEGGVSGNYNDTLFEDTEYNNRLRARLRTAESEFQAAVEELSVVHASTIDTSTREVVVGDFVEVSIDGDVEWEVDQVTDVDGPTIVKTAKLSPSEWLHSSKWRFLPELDLSDLKHLMTSNRGDELPIFLSYSTFANVVRQRYVSKWRSPMLKLFETYQTLLRKFATRVIHSTKCKPKLEQHLKQVANTILEHLSNVAMVELDKIMETESRPYTLNQQLSQVLMRLRTQPLIDGLDALSRNNDTNTVQAGAVKALLQSHTGIGKNTNEDQQAKELHLAIVAYMTVASKRFVDEIPMLLNSKYIRPFLSAMFNETSETPDGVLDRVLMDNMADVERYQTLANQLKSLEAAKTLINAH
ncbi:hypothetical protein DYB28_004724, partial [Aphanomyces astaci]